MAHTAEFGIGRLARDTGTKVQTIRYYEQIGLLPEPPRSPGNQRLYGPEDRARLAFIRQARELGFPLEQIRELLALSDQPQQACDEVDTIARSHLQQIERRMAQLAGLRRELQRMITACGHGGIIADCKIIDALATDGLALASQVVDGQQGDDRDVR